MSVFRYSADELKHLRNSHLVEKPESLPKIEQWIETSSEQHRKLRRNDDNDQPNKIGGTSEARSRLSYGANRDEIFLGPKISFASATSAARQPKPPEERFIGVRGFRDREKDIDRTRERPEGLNGHHDSETRTRLRSRKDSDGDIDRPRMKQRSGATDVEEDPEDTGAPRRGGLGRGRFDQPWFRDDKDRMAEKSRDEAKASNGDTKTWRKWGEAGNRNSKEVRNDHREQEPVWMAQAEPQDAEAHTAQDFQKWKEMMRAGNNTGKQESPSTSGNPAAGDTSKAEPEALSNAKMENLALEDSNAEPLFGKLGNRSEDHKPSGEAVSAAKLAGNKAKQSRFVGFFGAPPTPQEQAQATPGPRSPQPETGPTQSSEDKAGFNNIMQMLRMGGSQSQSQSKSAFAPPGHQSLDEQNLFPPKESLPATRNERQPHPPLPHQPPASRMYDVPHSPTARQPPNDLPPPHPQPNSRDNEFFLNLMKQQRSPFIEGQIYGQSYHTQKPSNDVSALLNNFSPPPQSKSRGPPPGFFENERVFGNHQAMDHHVDVTQLRQEHGHFPPQPRPFEHGHPPQPGINGARPPSREGIPPPPGFHSGRPPGPPPGFFGMGPQGPPPPHLQEPPPHMQRPPHMMFNGPPPGFAPRQPPSQMSQPQMPQLPPQRTSRPPSQQQLPPGFDIYSNPDRRGQMPPPPQAHAGYAQYLKQGGGTGSYPGM